MVQVSIYKDGEVVVDGAPQALQLEAQTDLTRIADYGYLRLQPTSDTWRLCFANRHLGSKHKRNELTVDRFRSGEVEDG